MHRLQRLDQLFVQTPQYFVTACTHDRLPILADPVVHDIFRGFCVKGRDWGTFVGRYVLMPDHLHLFVARPPGKITLSMWVKSLKNSLSKCWRREEIPAPHWQKGFFDHLLRSEESHSEKWKYVRENPVRAGLVEKAEDWPFSGEILPVAGSCPVW